MREQLRKSRILRRMVRWARRRWRAFPRWPALLGEEFAEWRDRARRADGPPILLATTLGGHWAGTTLDSLLAIALTLRGARVEVLLCDGTLSACQLCEVRAQRRPERFAAGGPQLDLCSGCAPPAVRFFEELGTPVHRLGQLLCEEGRARTTGLAHSTPAAEIPRMRRRGIGLGEHALAGALRYFARGDLAGEPTGEAVLRRYFAAALETEAALSALFDRQQYAAVVAHHGIYVPQGIVGAVARRHDMRTVHWTPAYRKRTFVFSHGDTYHHTLLDEPTEEWRAMSWGPEQEADLLRYLRSRWHGRDDWIWFHHRPCEDWPTIAREVGLRGDRPMVALLTNVIWDAQLHYRANAFPDMMAWVVESVRALRERRDLELVIRVHPAEIRGTLPSRQRVVEELARAIPELPENVHVIPPESPVSTYALVERANAALIYGTKTGMEVAATGKPVIVAGEAWVRGKGFTLDASSPEEYRRLLQQLPLPALDGRALELARRYAYHIFFRRMMPFEMLEPTGGDPPFRIDLGGRGLAALSPGASTTLDLVCRGILEGTPFTYPAEEFGGCTTKSIQP